MFVVAHSWRLAYPSLLATVWSRHDLHRLMAVPAANSIDSEVLSVDCEYLPRTDGFGSGD
jgi:hypothetical protein